MLTTGLVGANAGAVSLTATGAVSLAGAIAANGGAGPSHLAAAPAGAGGAVKRQRNGPSTTVAIQPRPEVAASGCEIHGRRELGGTVFGGRKRRGQQRRAITDVDGRGDRDRRQRSSRRA
jgi:hypothetical protein